jgi:hypothetical protein
MSDYPGGGFMPEPPLGRTSQGQTGPAPRSAGTIPIRGAPASSGERTSTVPSAPTVTLPKGGGAIRGIGEKFAANPVTGTGSLSVPIATSPSRSDFGPQLALSYDSGSGNGPFGFGWNLPIPTITRKTDKGLPQYRDADESDVFILSGAEDLVPVLVEVGGQWQRDAKVRNVDGVDYRIQRYRPRTEGLFARIERWTDVDTGEMHWRSISRDNITSLYGRTENSRIFDVAEPSHVFSWLICESYDDKGNAIIYEHKEENSDGVDGSLAHEENRSTSSRSANRYLKRIKYGNRVSRLIEPDLTHADWMFEVVFDYGEHYTEDVQGVPTVFIEDNRQSWGRRRDPSSTYHTRDALCIHRERHRVVHYLRESVRICAEATGRRNPLLPQEIAAAPRVRVQPARDPGRGA